MKHGLLARVIAPRNDFRKDDRLYWSIREELMSEFQPRTFSEVIEIDGLAYNLLQLARARQMLETLQKPSVGPSPDTARNWAQYQDYEGQATLIETLISQSTGKRLGRCSKCDAAKIAAIIHEMVSSNLAEMEELKRDRQEDPNEEEKWDEFDREAVAQLEARRKVIGPAAQRLLDEGFVTELLGGSKNGRRGDAARLLQLLQSRAAGLRRWLKDNERVPRDMDRLKEQELCMVAHAPSNVMLLQRYARKYEAAVERALRSLRKD